LLPLRLPFVLRACRGYFLNFTGYGLQINNGHEVMMDRCWLGETNFDYDFEQEGTQPTATAIQINGNDHYILNTIVFSSLIGLQVNGAADYITGVHVWFPINRALSFNDTKAFHVTRGGNRFNGCYADGTRAATAPLAALATASMAVMLAVRYARCDSSTRWLLYYRNYRNHSRNICRNVCERTELLTAAPVVDFAYVRSNYCTTLFQADASCWTAWGPTAGAPAGTRGPTASSAAPAKAWATSRTASSSGCRRAARSGRGCRQAFCVPVCTALR
jgi:hypothetical protein